MRTRSTPEVEDAEASDEHMGAPAPEGEKGHGEVTAFLSKEFLAGKDYKPGTKLTVVVKAVDPETGEAEVSCAPENYEEEPESADTMEAMDKAFPAEPPM